MFLFSAGYRLDAYERFRVRAASRWRCCRNRARTSGFSGPIRSPESSSTPPWTNPCTHQISVRTQYSMSAVSSMYPASAACSSTAVVMVISGWEYCRSRPVRSAASYSHRCIHSAGNSEVGDAEVDVAVDDLVDRVRRR